MTEPHRTEDRALESGRVHLADVRFGRTAAERRASQPPLESLGRPAVRLLCYHGRSAVPVGKIYIRDDRHTLVVDDERHDVWSFSWATASCHRCSKTGRGQWQIRPQALRERRRQHPAEVSMDVALVADRVCVLCRARPDEDGQGHAPACLHGEGPLAP